MSTTTESAQRAIAERFAQIEDIMDAVEFFWKRHPDYSLEELIERAHDGVCCTFIDDSALLDGLALFEFKEFRNRRIERRTQPDDNDNWND